MATPISPKVTSATLSGALAVVLVWAAGMADVTVPPEVAAAVTVILSAGAAYFKRDPLRAGYVAEHGE